MKKIISLIIIICLVTNYFSLAQNTVTKTPNASTSHVQVGLKAGVNISDVNYKNNNNIEHNAIIGFHAGAIAHIHISNNFAVQPEVVYSTQGTDRQNVKTKLNYINVPLLLQFMTNNGFRLQTGPQAGFLIGAKNKIGDVEINVKDLVNSVDFAWSFGASYLSKIGLGLDVRYNLGISNVNEDEATTKAMNRVWQIGAFYQFMH